MVRYARQPSIAKFRVREKEKRELSFPLWTFFAVWPAKEEGRKLSFDRISARKTATPCETKSDLSLFLSLSLSTRFPFSIPPRSRSFHSFFSAFLTFRPSIPLSSSVSPCSNMAGRCPITRSSLPATVFPRAPLHDAKATKKRSSSSAATFLPPPYFSAFSSASRPPAPSSPLPATFPFFAQRSRRAFFRANVSFHARRNRSGVRFKLGNRVVVARPVFHRNIRLERERERKRLKIYGSGEGIVEVKGARRGIKVEKERENWIIPTWR